MSNPRSEEILNVLLLTLILHISLVTAQFLAAWKLRCLPLMACALYSVVEGAVSVVSILTLHTIMSKHQGRSLKTYFHYFAISSTVFLALVVILSGAVLCVNAHDRAFGEFPPAIFSWFGICLLGGALVLNAGIPQIEKRASIRLRSAILSECSSIKEWGAVPPGLAIAGILMTKYSWIYADAVATVLIVIMHIPVACRIVQLGISPFMRRKLVFFQEEE